MLGALATPSASALAQAEAPAGTAEITIAAGPCFGSCPVYSARLSANGTGRFVGTRFVARIGEQSFTADPSVFREIEEKLAPYRPMADRRIGPEECETFRTDAPSWTVRWVDRTGTPVSLALSLGCQDVRYVPIAEAIRAARDLMPIAPLIGKATRQQPQ
ncbi:hypothetical protein SAMN06295912_10211 [Sphingomonas laterariae]|uniref:DUF6438 domain-containing protein n=1 Tax=Edaphosphingomonas laterariae TaxID=861865 RepID=A0A239C4T1_9SPHN|nr:DUF6438 domain-containing protein [Sphingomonas laterariae]SNS15257.1 hypothetical protein SAMN06295912_10211 [Sphingomonas laterariae]